MPTPQRWTLSPSKTHQRPTLLLRFSSLHGFITFAAVSPVLLPADLRAAKLMKPFSVTPQLVWRHTAASPRARWSPAAKRPRARRAHRSLSPPSEPRPRPSQPPKARGGRLADIDSRSED